LQDFLQENDKSAAIGFLLMRFLEVNSCINKAGKIQKKKISTTSFNFTPHFPRTAGAIVPDDYEPLTTVPAGPILTFPSPNPRRLALPPLFIIPITTLPWPH
jgi:hypothetical protein